MKHMKAGTTLAWGAGAPLLLGIVIAIALQRLAAINDGLHDVLVDQWWVPSGR